MSDLCGDLRMSAIVCLLERAERDLARARDDISRCREVLIEMHGQNTIRELKDDLRQLESHQS